MKGGLIQLVWAMKAAASLGLPRPNVRLILNGDKKSAALFPDPSSRKKWCAASRSSCLKPVPTER
ncbi:hypothetical protein IWX64_000873 [Arthrobacter sp. CAN_A212]